MMKKIVLVTVAVWLAFQQVLGATDQEVEDAYSDFANVTNTLLGDIAGMRDNYASNFLAKLNSVGVDGKLVINNTVEEINQLIQTMAARTDIDVTKCFLGTTLQSYVDDAFGRLDTCLVDLRYNTAYNTLLARWFDISQLGRSYLSCTQNAIANCKGNEACNDQIIAEIAEKKEAVAPTLNLLAADMHNGVDSFSVNCKDSILMDVFSFSSNYVDYVSACIDTEISNRIPPICKES